MKAKTICFVLVLVLVFHLIGSCIDSVSAQDMTDPEIRVCIKQVLGEYGITIPDSWLDVKNGKATVWIPTTEGLWNIIVGLNDALLTCVGLENMEVWAGGQKLLYDMHLNGNDLIMTLVPVETDPLYQEFMALMQENYTDLFIGFLYMVMIVGLDGSTLFREIVDLVPVELTGFAPAPPTDIDYVLVGMFSLLFVLTIVVLWYWWKNK